MSLIYCQCGRDYLAQLLRMGGAARSARRGVRTMNRLPDAGIVRARAWGAATC